jgi:GTP-binding protein
MLVDEVKTIISGGDGGEGKVSFGKIAKSGPDGGNGGDGGDVSVVASSDLTLLKQFLAKPKIKAQDGFRGDIKKMSGKNGESLILELPVGSHLVDKKTKEEFELKEIGEVLLLCKGGAGGIGNFDLRSSRNTTPMKTVLAKKGQVRRLKITLKFIADYGLIGLPSAGKSSLLNELTNANVKTAPYHFTTLSANLGVLPNKKIIADIPGLIEGASEGKGLGINFLKHIQKVSTLLHCISTESKNPLEDYKVIRTELEKYSKELLGKEEIILITKSDLISKKELETIKKVINKINKKILVTSIHDEESIESLSKLLK